MKIENFVKAAAAILAKWHSKDSNFLKKEPKYLSLLRRGLEENGYDMDGNKIV